MSFKVVRINGLVVAFGPNDDNYEPGQTYVIEEAEPVMPAVVPASITMRQARRALLAAGLLTTVNNAIASMTGPEGDAARIDWEFSSMVFRDATLVKSLAPALGLTDAQLDSLFIAASQIPA